MFTRANKSCLLLQHDHRSAATSGRLPRHRNVSLQCHCHAILRISSTLICRIICTSLNRGAHTNGWTCTPWCGRRDERNISSFDSTCSLLRLLMHLIYSLHFSIFCSLRFLAYTISSRIPYAPSKVRSTTGCLLFVIWELFEMHSNEILKIDFEEHTNVRREDLAKLTRIIYCHEQRCRIQFTVAIRSKTRRVS